MKRLSLALFLVSAMQILSCSSMKASGRSTTKAAGHVSILSQVDNIIKQADPNINIGIKIVSLKDNKTIFERNSERHYMPASTIKLATIAAALYYLGPSYRFNTHILTDGFDTNNSLKNIYLQGSGDPSLMDYDLRKLAFELRQMGIKRINGNIYIDDQIFDNILWYRGAMWDDRHSAAPVCGLNINYNRVEIKTIAGHSSSAPAHALVRPCTKHIKVSSRAITKAEGAQRSLNLSVEHEHKEKPWPSDSYEGLSLGDHVFINGQTTKNSPAHYSLLAMKDPAAFAGSYLQEQLELLGIKISGTVERKKTPPEAVKLATHQSRALSEAIIDFTKVSNNLPNQGLVKAIAAQSGMKPATFSGGLKLIADFLDKEVGISPQSMISADGAGESRYNLITPDQMVKLLKYAANHFTMGPEFMAAMPLAGLDGTLTNKFKAPHLRGNIRAKTGSLAGVSCLAGYFIGDRGDRFAFSIMVNGFVGSSVKYQLLQEEILATLVQNRENQIARIK